MKKELIVGSIVVLAAMAVLLLTATAKVPSPPLSKAAFAVERLTCGACSENVRKALINISGVAEVQTDVGQGRTMVTYDAARTNVVTIAQAITAAGYPATSIALNTSAAVAPVERTGCGGSCCGTSAPQPK